MVRKRQGIDNISRLDSSDNERLNRDENWDLAGGFPIRLPIARESAGGTAVNNSFYSE